MILKQIILLFIAFSLSFSNDIVEFDSEYDIYYSNISAYINLDTASEIRDASQKQEVEIYKELISHTFNPNIFLAEIAVHPMPILGVYLRSEQKSFYNKMKIKSFNTVKSITAGFDEPYSLSLFFGRMMLFKKKDMSVKNRAFIGYLFTIGDYTIKNNILYPNKWLRIEFKLKGTKNTQKKDLDWSFRVGTQFNKNKDFANTFYVGARRSSKDYTKSIYSFVNNSAFNNLIEFDYNFELTKAEFVYEKKIPLKWFKKLTFSVGIGYLYDNFKKFRGKLKVKGGENHQLLIRPNLEF